MRRPIQRASESALKSIRSAKRHQLRERREKWRTYGYVDSVSIHKLDLLRSIKVLSVISREMGQLIRSMFIGEQDVEKRENCSRSNGSTFRRCTFQLFFLQQDHTFISILSLDNLGDPFSFAQEFHVCWRIAKLTWRTDRSVMSSRGSVSGRL